MVAGRSPWLGASSASGFSIGASTRSRRRRERIPSKARLAVMRASQPPKLPRAAYRSREPYARIKSLEPRPTRSPGPRGYVARDETPGDGDAETAVRTPRCPRRDSEPPERRHSHPGQQRPSYKTFRRRVFIKKSSSRGSEPAENDGSHDQSQHPHQVHLDGEPPGPPVAPGPRNSEARITRKRVASKSPD